LKGRESLVVFATDISYGHDVFKMLGRETRYNSLRNYRNLIGRVRERNRIGAKSNLRTMQSYGQNPGYIGSKGLTVNRLVPRL
jgi:hypothetical protein